MRGLVSVVAPARIAGRWLVFAPHGLGVNVESRFGADDIRDRKGAVMPARAARVRRVCEAARWKWLPSGARSGSSRLAGVALAALARVPYAMFRLCRESEALTEPRGLWPYLWPGSAHRGSCAGHARGAERSKRACACWKLCGVARGWNSGAWREVCGAPRGVRGRRRGVLGCPTGAAMRVGERAGLGGGG